MTIVEFLLARIAEDEALVDDCDHSTRPPIGGLQSVDIPHEFGGVSLYDFRLAAECEAKRAAVDLAILDEDAACEDDDYNGYGFGDRLLRALAAVYADHPDYRPEWDTQGSGT